MSSNSNILAQFAPRLSNTQVVRRAFGQSVDMLANQALAMNVMGWGPATPVEDLIAKTRVALNKDKTAKLNKNKEAVRSIVPSLKGIAKNNLEVMVASITEGYTAVFKEKRAECEAELKLAVAAAEPLLQHDAEIVAIAVEAAIKAEIEAAAKAKAEAKAKEEADLAAAIKAEEDAKVAVVEKKGGRKAKEATPEPVLVTA